MRMRQNGYRYFLALFLIFSFFTNCSDNPTSPTNTSLGTLLTSITIGSDGGEINTENFDIYIPSGAFDVPYDIKIYSYPDELTFEGNTVSEPIMVTGLPAQFQNPISIRIRYSGELSESSFIAHGFVQHDNISNDSLRVYGLYAATESEGYLVTELPAATANISLNKTQAGEFYISNYARAFFQAVTGMKTMETEHFFIKYPVTLQSSMDRFSEVLEGALDVLADKVWNQDIFTNEKWGITLVAQDQTVNGSLNPHVPPIFTVSRDAVRLSEFVNIKHEALKSFYRYSLYYFLSEKSLEDKAAFEWLETAIFAWLETFTSENTNFITPKKFDENPLAPLNGLRAGAGTDDNADVISQHGNGMASLIKFLIADERLGEDGIIKIFQNMNSNQDPASALINAVDALLLEWWPDYIQALVNGEIYPMPMTTLNDNFAGTWNITTDTDTLQVFSSTDEGVGLYPDISAKLFKINVNRSVSNDEKMYFQFTGPGSNMGLSLAIFGIKNNTLEYLGTAHAQDFEIPNLKAYYNDNMRKFLAVMINNTATQSYLGTTDIDLTITTQDPSQTGGGNGSSLDCNHCIVGAQTLASFSSNATGSDENYTEVYAIGSTSIPGSFNGNVFTGSYYPYTNVQETVTIVLNDSHDRVLQIDFDRINDNEEYDAYDERGFSGGNMLVHKDDASRFELRGADICSNITNFYQSTTAVDVYINLTGYGCNESSYIFVSFSKK